MRRESVDMWTLALEKLRAMAVLDGQALAVGLHLRLEEVVAT